MENKTEDTREPANGDIYDGSGEHLGTIDAFPDIGSIFDRELCVFHDGYLYTFKFDYRVKAETENVAG